MTATLREPAPAPPVADAPPAKKKRNRRWLRLIIPLGVVVLAMASSGIAYLVQQPNQRDGNYLSPESTAAVGGSRLAVLLRQRQITVERRTKTSDALVAAYSGDVTLFIPTPDLVHPFYLRMLKLMPASTRIVLVDPGNRTLATGYVPIGVRVRTLRARAVAPACDLPEARDAGVAGVYRSVFTAVDTDVARELYRCYGGAVVVFSRGLAQTTVVGAADPFRNDRIIEHRNQQLAVGLLATVPRVIWLDLHRREAPPGYVDNPALGNQPAAPPSLGPGTPDPDFPIPRGSEPAPGAPRAPQGDGSGGGGGSNPMWQLFPPWLFGMAALLAVALLLFALARGRRLGAPIVEPLPIAVRATETVEGRGRLYQRAKARAPALSVLRGAAREKLAHLLDLGANPDRAALVTAAAAQSGWPPEAVDEALFGAEPDNDNALVEAAARLEALLEDVKGDKR